MAWKSAPDGDAAQRPFQPGWARSRSDLGSGEFSAAYSCGLERTRSSSSGDSTLTPSVRIGARILACASMPTR